MNETEQPETTTVVAEDAPIGVQLWPTTHPHYADNFTLREVQIVRTQYFSFVRWVYYGGNERIFATGEKVTVQYVK